MSKKKQQTTDSTETTETGRKAYDFSQGRRCPVCGGLDTEARSTQGNIQYRRCRRIGCKHHHQNYAVVGKEI